MDATKLKSLQRRQGELQSKVDDLKNSIADLQRQLNTNLCSLNQVKSEIVNISKSKPIVSEHALLRYIERVMCVDLKAIEKDILTEKIICLLEQFPSGKYPSVISV
jgi:chromosome segregation ATPase